MKTIGATKTADLVQKAILVYQDHCDWVSNSRERFRGPSWQDADYQAEPTLNAIDDARCTEEASAHDYGLLISYARRHPEEFLHDENRRGP